MVNQSPHGSSRRNGFWQKKTWLEGLDMFGSHQDNIYIFIYVFLSDICNQELTDKKKQGFMEFKVLH